VFFLIGFLASIDICLWVFGQQIEAVFGISIGDEVSTTRTMTLLSIYAVIYGALLLLRRIPAVRELLADE
jgi:hypothetical protein